MSRRKRYRTKAAPPEARKVAPPAQPIVEVPRSRKITRRERRERRRAKAAARGGLIGPVGWRDIVGIALVCLGFVGTGAWICFLLGFDLAVAAGAIIAFGGCIGLASDRGVFSGWRDPERNDDLIEYAISLDESTKQKKAHKRISVLEFVAWLTRGETRESIRLSARDLRKDISDMNKQRCSRFHILLARCSITAGVLMPIMWDAATRLCRKLPVLGTVVAAASAIVGRLEGRDRGGSPPQAGPAG
jgi:hypothetical protein